jgi:hypothetical protein
LAAKVAGNERNEGGDRQRWSLAFDDGDEWQQQRWQWWMEISLNGGDNGQCQGGGEMTVQWTTTAVAAARTVTGQRR